MDAKRFKLEYVEVLKFLDRLTNRKAAVLFYAYNHDLARLCTWLVSPHTNPRIVSHVQDVDTEKLASLQRMVVNGLGVTRMSSNRAPIHRGHEQPTGDLDQPISADEALRKANAALKTASALLLPKPISEAIASYVDTLIIVPMTVIYGNEIYGREGDLKRKVDSEVPTTAIGTLSFAALSVGNKLLLDTASIVISPGFLTFKFPPRTARQQFSSPVIAGDPSKTIDKDWTFPRLPRVNRVNTLRAVAQRYPRKELSTPFRVIVHRWLSVPHIRIDKKVKSGQRSKPSRFASFGLSRPAASLDLGRSASTPRYFEWPR